MVNPLPALRRLPPAARLLIAGTFVNKLGSFIIPYLTLVLRREFGLTESEVGRLLFAYGAGSLVSVLAGGALTDRLGRRATLLTSLLGSGVLAIAMGLADSARTLVPLLVLFGFIADLYRPAASAVIGDVLPSADRAVGFAALRLAINLGFGLGVALGGLLADWSWRALFLGDGATTLAYGLVVLFLLPETRRVPRGRPGSAPPVTGPWRDPVFAQLLFCSLVFAIVFFNHVSTLPLTVTGAGYPARVLGALVAVNGFLIALFEVPVVDALRGRRRLRLAALGTLLVGVGFGLTGVAAHWAWFLVTVVLWTAGEILSTPFKLAFLTDWAPPEARGRYLSGLTGTWSLAIGLNPLLFLPLQARLGDRAFWPLMALLVVPAVLVLWRLDRVADRPELLRGRDEPPPEPARLAFTADPGA
jgi:MFS family permease